MKKIGFRIEGGKKWGMGHVYRCRNLIEELGRYDIQCLVYSHFNNAIREVLNTVSYKGIEITYEDELRFMVDSVNAEGLDTLVIDMLDTSEEYVKALRSCVRVVGFDDCGAGGVFLDSRINAIVLPPENLKSLHDYVGNDYIVLNQNVRKYAKKRKHIREEIGKVLLSFGGSDPMNITEDMLKLLHKSGKEVTAVVGPADDMFDQLKQYENETCRILRNVDYLADLIFESDLCYVSGGITLYEVMAIGTPCCVICQVPHQVVTAERFEEVGAVINYGLAETVDWNRIKCDIVDIELDYPGRLALSKKSKQCIDAQGIERVSEILKGDD